MMPMVFCASLPPWPRLYSEADTSCSRRNQRSTRDGGVRKKVQPTITIMIEPSRKPRNGEIRIKATVFSRPLPTSAPVPALATAAPTSPPISACDDDDGMP
ncbi:hypothetical protein D3C81_1231660 [compost metagenome]